MKCCGPKGRWKSNLIGKCLRDGKSYDDASVSPVVRQTLQHWGYRLTRAHFDAGSARVKAKGAAYLPRSQLQHVLDKPKKRGGDAPDADEARKAPSGAEEARRGSAKSPPSDACCRPTTARRRRPRARERGSRVFQGSFDTRPVRVGCAPPEHAQRNT